VSRLLHALRLCGCPTGDSWHVDGRCVPLKTAAFEREQRAVSELRASRRTVLAVARRGHVRGE
jgi:hypothetical protein